jgi:hypothetical protein
MTVFTRSLLSLLSFKSYWYTDIEVIVEMDGDIRDTVQLVKTLERPLTESK